jgi:hypothetical protein
MYIRNIRTAEELVVDTLKSCTKDVVIAELLQASVQTTACREIGPGVV